MSVDSVKRIFNDKVKELNDASNHRSLFLDNERQARRALATLVAQLFSCPDAEHCFTRERAHWQLFCCGNKAVAAGCSLTHSRGNRTVAVNDRTHMFQCGRAHWQLNSCLLAAVRCTNLVSGVIQLCLS